MNRAIKSNKDKRHIVLLYDKDDDKYEYLASYFQEGLDNNMLCIFVSLSPQADIIANFKARGLDLVQAIKNKKFRIFGMSETYLPNGNFSVDYMIKNVEMFIKSAKVDGYDGIYTAGEMVWLFDKPESWYQVAEYEQKITDLQKEQSLAKALCLYPTGISSFIEECALQAHPA